MSHAPRLIARIALFAALIYVLSWGLAYLPNIKLTFFIIFTAGYVWGAVPGLLVGGIGTFLWTTFNPYGPTDLPIAMAQVVAAALIGPLGRSARRLELHTVGRAARMAWLMVAAILGTATYFGIVNTVDAWVYQPFWPRFTVGAAWALWSLAGNLMIFPLLFPITAQLYQRECRAAN